MLKSLLSTYRFTYLLPVLLGFGGSVAMCSENAKTESGDATANAYVVDEYLQAQLRSGANYMRAGELEKGQTILSETYASLQQLSREHPESASPVYAAGLCALFAGDGDLAEAIFRKALEMEPGHENAVLGLVKLYSQKGSVYRAIAETRKALERNPESEALNKALGELLVTNGKTEEAVDVFETLVVAHPENTSYSDRLLELYSQIGDVVRAKPLLDKQVEEGRLDADERDLRLVDLYLKSGSWREVPQLLQQAKRNDPENAFLDGYFARLYQVRGEEAGKKGDWSRAVLFYERSLEFSPGETKVVRAISSAYLEIGDYEAATEQLSTLLESKPSDPQFYIDFAEAQLGLGKAKLAFDIIDQAYAASRSRGNVAGMEAFAAARERFVEIARSPEHLSRLKQTPAVAE